VLRFDRAVLDGGYDPPSVRSARYVIRLPYADGPDGIPELCRGYLDDCDVVVDLTGLVVWVD